MLERIGNISLEIDFKKSKRGKYSHAKGGVFENAAFKANDSISFSPASKYLSRANWLLKEFNHSAEDKVWVEFIYGGYYFEVNLDIKNINSMETINYSIRREDPLKLENDQIIATIRAHIGEGNDSMPLQRELKGLNQLFQRFFSLNLKNELNIYNYELIDTLLDGIYSTLQNDFTYLNCILINFLEKQTDRKLNILLNKNKRTTDLNLLKIKPFLNPKNGRFL